MCKQFQTIHLATRPNNYKIKLVKKKKKIVSGAVSFSPCNNEESEKLP